MLPELHNHVVLQAELDRLITVQTSLQTHQSQAAEELLSCSRCGGIHIFEQGVLDGCLHVKCLYCQQPLPQIKVQDVHLSVAVTPAACLLMSYSDIYHIYVGAHTAHGGNVQP